MKSENKIAFYSRFPEGFHARVNFQRTHTHTTQTSHRTSKVPRQNEISQKAKITLRKNTHSKNRKRHSHEEKCFEFPKKLDRVLFLKVAGAA